MGLVLGFDGRWYGDSLDLEGTHGSPSSIDHLLPAPLFHFRLPLTLPGSASFTSSSTTQQPSHPASHASVRAESQPSTVGGHCQPAPPCPISEQCNCRNTRPGPVKNIPHPFRQTLGLEVLAGALEVAVLSVRRAGEALEIEFNDQ